MIDLPPSIDLFCSEFIRLAEIIDAPSDYIPECRGAHDDQGLHVALTPDTARYILTYKEKSDVAVIVESSDPDIILEHAFIEITSHMAGRPAETGANSGEGLYFDQNLSRDELKSMAIQLHLRTSSEQERLLGLINRDWQMRQSVRNVQVLPHIEKFFE